MQVVKRDNTTEEFDRSKLVRVANAAGLTLEEAEGVAQKVEDQLLEQKSDKILSNNIRDLMFQELQKVNDYAANLYKWYEKVKGKTLASIK